MEGADLPLPEEKWLLEQNTSLGTCEEGRGGVLQLIWVITTRPPGPTRLVPFPFFFTAANFPPMSNPRFSLLSPLSKHHPLGYIPYVGLGHISANGLEVGRERERGKA